MCNTYVYIDTSYLICYYYYYAIVYSLHCIFITLITKPYKNNINTNYNQLCDWPNFKRLAAIVRTDNYLLKVQLLNSIFLVGVFLAWVVYMGFTNNRIVFDVRMKLMNPWRRNKTTITYATAVFGFGCFFILTITTIWHPSSWEIGFQVVVQVQVSTDDEIISLT